jgi:hypothetical protein
VAHVVLSFRLAEDTDPRRWEAALSIETNLGSLT